MKPAFLSRFSRITSTGSFIPEIDGLRFVAITSVFLFHVSGYVAAKSGAIESRNLSGLVEHLSFGVQLFFVISGFILALPFADPVRRPSTRAYLLRRLTRIEPTYVINILFVFALLTLFQHRHEGLMTLLSSLTYTSSQVFGANPLTSVAWSLEIEIQFYLLAPLLFRAFRLPSLRRRLVFLAIALASIATQFLVPSRRIQLSLIGQAQYFLAGVLLADFYSTFKWAGAARRWTWDAVSIAAWIALSIAIRFHSLELLIGAVLILVAYVGAFRGVLLGWFLRQPGIATIGGMCYTIYLYHYMFISAVGRFTFSFSRLLPVQAVLMGVPTLSGCAILFLLAERPFMKKNWWKPSPTTSVEPKRGTVDALRAGVGK